MTSVEVFFGLGGNIGDRALYLQRAAHALSKNDVLQLSGFRLSSLYETPAQLPPNAPQAWDTPFYNAVVVASTCADPFDILQQTQSMERQLGRQDRGHWGPREIDIDILVYGERVLLTPALTLPHPLLPERRFVLQPLAELKPQWRHPVTNLTALEMLALLPASDITRLTFDL